MQFLQSLGLEAFTYQVDLPGQGIFHRVLVGRFQDRGEVDAMQERLKKEFDLPTGWVISGSAMDR
jgi:cell division septation protein DedD